MTTPASPWTLASAPAHTGNAPVVTLVEGSTFCVGDSTGAIDPGRAHGLFVRDTRVVSRWELTIDGVTPTPLDVQQENPFSAIYLGRVAPRTDLADSTLLVVRRRYVGDGMREDISIRSSAPHAVELTIELRVDADFADLFEVKEARALHVDGVVTRADGRGIQIGRRRGSHEQTVLFTAEREPALHDGRLRWSALIPARGEWCVTVEATPGVDGVPLQPRHPRGIEVGHALPAKRLREWRRTSPVVRTTDPSLTAVLRRSVEDLGSLRIFDPADPNRVVIAAGSPWFMALFGRDSLLTSWMVLPIDPTLAIGTLQTLADHQGVATDTATEEQPGRILHEIRFGPATDFNLGGRNVYYGTADASPLFVMLLGELRRWGGDSEAVQALRPAADHALDWIEHYGDADGDGFVEYETSAIGGLANQGWKDSWDGINFADGSFAQAPIALAEVQGYCYAAFRTRARFAVEDGDPEAARRWSDKAGGLKRAFNERFWLPDRGWFAVGLDKDKRPIDALTSNIGHCLWTGIVDDDKAQAVADHLMSPEMFSGWGIRTLASSMAGYNPMSYHNGSVWPHDNAICASGLMRYGLVEQAQRVAIAMLAAAAHFDHRLPELFCGFERDAFPEPVPYPTSCSPQAWAAATPVSLVRTLLRLDPKLPQQLWCAPAVPARYLPLSVSGVRVGGLDLSIDVDDDSWQLTGLTGSGIDLVMPPAGDAEPC